MSSALLSTLDMAVTVGYAGATGRDLGFGGERTSSININQIRPEVALAAFPANGGGWDPTKLRESIPNPFFGIPEAGEFAGRETIQRGQLLRPFPAFGNLRQFETTEGGPAAGLVRADLCRGGGRVSGRV